MPPMRRKFGRSLKRKAGTGAGAGAIALAAKRRRVALAPAPTLARRVNNLYNMIETKEYTRTVSNVTIAHNNITVLALNPFQSSIDGLDPMGSNTGSRIGDAISVRGLMLRGFLETSLGRAKVYFRVMLIRSAKGDVPTRATLFKGSSANKMIDQINTERFSVLSQTIFTVSSSNSAALSVGANGVPGSGTPAGIATRTIKMWIPGKRFGRNGTVTYENASTTQVKFYDYSICVLAYDWYGTPQDINNVGLVNELYTKVYFKDA